MSGDRSRSPIGSRETGCVVLVLALLLSLFAAGPVVAADLAPSRVIGGPNTQLRQPGGNALDSQGNIYVGNCDIDSVSVFAPNANGDAVPIRLIGGPATGLDDPCALLIDGQDRLFSASSRNDSIRVFAAGANGNASPLWSISGPATQLDEPAIMAFDSAGYLYVACGSGESVLVFAPGAQGDVAPVRVIKGPATGLDNPLGVVIGAGDELYVSDTATGSIRVWPPGADGNVAPARIIAGSATQIVRPLGLAFDTGGNVYVADEGNKVLAFPSTANGDVVPIVVIAGASTGLNIPAGLTIGPAGAIYVSNRGGDTVSIFNSPLAAQTIAFAPLANREISAAKVRLSATASSGLPVGFGSNTPAACSVTGDLLTLLAPGTCQIEASQGGDSVYAAAPVVRQSFTILGRQQPTHRCAATDTTIPRRGIKRLLKSKCETNVDQRVGVKVTAKLRRGDQTLFSLHCRVAGKLRPTASTPYRNGTRLCRKGALIVRTYGFALRVKVLWYAPATDTVGTYRKARVYRT